MEGSRDVGSPRGSTGLRTRVVDFTIDQRFYGPTGAPGNTRRYQGPPQVFENRLRRRYLGFARKFYFYSVTR